MTSLSASFSKSRNPVVTMSLAGDVSVIERLLKKKKLLDTKNSYHREIRPLLILPAGAMRGAIEAGIGLAFEKEKIVDAFDTVVGVSAGAAVAYYLLANEAAIGGRIIFDDMVRDHFINFIRVTNIIDVNGFEKIMRDIKPIEQKRLLDSRSDFYVGVTNVLTGKGDFVNVKKNDDPLRAVIASLCVPILSGKEVEIAKHVCFDGGVAMPLPVSDVIKVFQPTDILVAMSNGMEESRMYPKFADPLLQKVFSLCFTPGVRDDIFNKHEKYKKELEYIQGGKDPSGVRICAIYPKESAIDLYTMDKNLLRDGMLDAMEFTQKLFA